MRLAPRAAPFSGGGVVPNPKYPATLPGPMSYMVIYRQLRQS